MRIELKFKNSEFLIETGQEAPMPKERLEMIMNRAIVFVATVMGFVAVFMLISKIGG